MLLITLFWVSCAGLTSHPGGIVIPLVNLCSVSCDGLASHPGGSNNTLLKLLSATEAGDKFPMCDSPLAFVRLCIFLPLLYSES